MSVKIISEDGQKLTVQVTVDISGSMLEAEDKIMAACNALGSLSTKKALDHFDTDGIPIQMGEKKNTQRKRKKIKNTKRHMDQCILSVTYIKHQAAGKFMFHLK